MRKYDLLHLFFASPFLLFSLPLQHQLIHGTATLEESPGVLTITASDQTILHWQDFSIGEKETAHFVLPNSHSSILNRVIEANPSCLLGKLESNGRVLLINPHGVLVGAHAQIDTGSFIASALDALDSAFLDGKELSFTGPSEASIVNFGKINASEGEVFLIARHVENRGTIDAQGDVGVIAAATAILKPKDLSSISIRTDEFVSDSDNFFSYAFHRNSDAKDFDFADTTAAMSGEIRSRGDQVTLLGNFIQLEDNSSIDVSGDTRAGTVLIGGDFKGKNPNIHNALQVYTSPTAKIDASTRVSGDGGRVVLWGDQANYFYGKICADAGVERGDGGTVEVSSPGLLDFNGLVTTLAPQGKLGSLLLDPPQITISAAASAGVNITACPASVVTGTAAAGILNVGTLQANLMACNVLVDTNTGGAGLGHIILATPLTIAAGSVGSLTLNAANNITINALCPIVNDSGVSAITMTSIGGSISIGSSITYSSAVGTGGLTLNANAGNITTLAAGDFTYAGLSGNTNMTASGLITLGGDITYSNAAATASLSFTSGNGMAVNAPIIAATNTPGAILFTDVSAAQMTFAASVQNANNGAITITRGAPAGAIRIGGSVNASVGSQNGATTINAPSSAITLQSVLSVVSQVGFFTPSGATATGPINITCNSLTMNSPATATVQIGHGQSRTNDNNATANANINITAINNITANSQAGGGHIFIGHGSRGYTGAAGGSNQTGNINVVSQNGSITLVHPSSVNSHIRIGHGYILQSTIGATHPALTGNITVSAPQGAINLFSNQFGNSTVMVIGHGSPEPTFGASAITGDILVECLGNMTLDGVTAAGSTQTVSVGCLYVLGNPNVNQNIRAVAGGNILLQSSQQGQIGCAFRVGGGAVYTGDIEVVAGGNLTMTCTRSEVLIGVNPATGVVVGQSLSNVSVAAGGNITVNILAATVAGTLGIIQAGGNVSVAAGGTITCTAGNAPINNGGIRIGTDHLNGGAANTRIYAGGDIIATNSITGTVTLGYAELNSPPYNVQIRAGGDIQMADGIDGAQSPTTGSIFIEADSLFQTGEFWTYAGTNITSICGLPLNLPISNALLGGISAVTYPNPGTPLTPDGFGAFRVLTVPNAANMRNNIILETTTGDITVNSACSRVDGTAQPLVVGVAALANVPGVNNLDIRTTNGNLTISGSVCANAFHDVTINSVANPWTSDTVAPMGLNGNILIRACDSIFINDDVVTSGPAGALGSITMISDNDLEGTGDIQIGDGMLFSPTISTIDGSITLSAGLKDPITCTTPAICAGVLGGTANINHNANTLVTCLGIGTIVETAAGSINLTNADIITQSGSIHLLAGVDINIGSTIQNLVAAGEIILVANRDINLLDAAALIDSPNAVTLVVDNDFPNPFLAGPGKITAAAGSNINGNPLQIFTSQQAFNSLLGNLNGVAFTAGQLFEDTSLEQWCTYFGCPFQRAGFGIPYTLFYKNCLQQAMNQAQIIVGQFLVDLHPYNEYPGWVEEFFVSRDEWRWTPAERKLMGFKDPYMIRRRILHAINLPKYWTNLTGNGYFPELED